MNEPQILLLFFGILITQAGAFFLGWNLAVGRWRAGRRKLIIRVRDLEQQANAFHEAIEKDPERGWLNTGAYYALGQIENTVEQLREELVRREK